MPAHQKIFRIVKLILVAGSWAAAAPGWSAELAAGPYSTMRMLLEKTIFQVDAAEVTVQVGETAQRKLRSLVHGKEASEELEKTIANAMVNAETVRITMRFLRDVDFDLFTSETISSTECAHKAGVIPESELQRVKSRFKEWFSPVRERGIREGDRLVYLVNGKSVHVELNTAKDETLVEYTHTGEHPRYSILGAYFAECSDFRESLIESLFQDGSA